VIRRLIELGLKIKKYGWEAERERETSRHQLFGRPDRRPFLGMVYVFGRPLDPQNGRGFK
jgi:hypothetical protein